jgi:hypothetical protein
MIGGAESERSEVEHDRRPRGGQQEEDLQFREESIKLIQQSIQTYCGMYAREVDVTRLRKRALLENGRPQQYPDGVFYRVGPQAINPRERSSSREHY